MDPLAISRRLLLERIAPEEIGASTYNDDEVMLLLSEVYNNRLTGSELNHLKIKFLSPIIKKEIFLCKFCKSKFKKEVKYLRHFINCKDEFNEGKREEKFHLKLPQQVQIQKKKPLDELRKKKLKEILTNDIDEYNNSEISFMLKNIYYKKLSTIDKQILMI